MTNGSKSCEENPHFAGLFDQVRGGYVSPNDETLEHLSVCPDCAMESWRTLRISLRQALELRRTGITSTCCSARISMSRGDGVMIGSCDGCQQQVCRMNPRTEVAEWLDGASPWAKQSLRPMEIVAATT